MEYVKDLETPAVIVDLDIMEKNLKHTAELARNAGVKLRQRARRRNSGTCKEHNRVAGD